VVGAALANKMKTILWDVDPRDWAMPGTGAIISNVLGHARRGSIIVMHDGGGDRSQTLAALPAILRGLRHRRLRGVKISALLRGRTRWR
jgi:peptidoglycan/xylan/chitin deacetylase (PgdA/CDA1 family)